MSKPIYLPRFRRGLLLCALLYLLLPAILFLFGWVTCVIALPLAVMLICSTLYVWRQIGKTRQPANSVFVCTKNDLFALALALLIALFMVEAISFHAHLYQPGDFWIRNPIYNMLLTQDWPIYGQTGKQFIYYHDFWLVPAWISRVLPVISPQTVLFIWTYIGLALAIALFFSRFRSKVLLFLLFLIFFGTISNNINPIYKYLIAEKGAHPEFADILIILDYLGFGTSTRFHSFWNCFCHGFNSILPGLVFISVVFSRCIPVKYLFFVLGLSSVYSPLASVLMFPYLAKSLFNNRFTINSFKETVFNVPLWICAACVLLHAMFFIGLSGQEAGTEWRFIWSDSAWWTANNPPTFNLLWVRLLRVGIVYTALYVPLYCIMGHRFRRLQLWRFVSVTSLLMMIVIYGRMNNELSGKGGPLMFIILSLLLCVRFQTAPRRLRFWILVLLAASCLHVPVDLLKRGICEYSWSDTAKQRHMRDPLHGTIDVPGFVHFQNFWGDNKFSPVLYGEAGEGMQHFPLKGTPRLHRQTCSTGEEQ